jgi:SAM-dependent methyltransferase
MLGLSPERYAFLECRRCGSLSADPLPAPQEIAALYPASYMFRWAQAPGRLQRLVQQAAWWAYHRWVYHEAVASVIKLSGRRSGRLLDVGCGSGIHLRQFRAAGFEVEGVEISPTDCEAARQSVGCPVHQGTLASVPLPTAQFDVITLFNVLEHLLDPREEIRRIWRLLKPGGWVVLQFPVADGWQPALFKDRWRDIREVPRHLSIPSTPGVSLLLCEAGFVGVQHGDGPAFERACAVSTSLYPLGIPYLNEHRAMPAPVKLFNAAVGALLTYLALPLVCLESLAHRPSAIFLAGQRPPSS